MRLTLTFQIFLLAAGLALLAPVAVAAPPPADLPLAGDSRHAWFAQVLKGDAIEAAASDAEPAEGAEPIDADADRVLRIWHRGPDADDEPALRRALAIEHRDLPAALAARDSRLWMVHGDNTLLSVAASRQPYQQGWSYERRTHPRLPDELEIRHIAADARGLWVLVHSVSPAALAAVSGAADDDDRPSLRSPVGRDPEQRRRLLFGLPPHGIAPSEAEPPPDDPNDQTPDTNDDAAGEQEDALPMIGPAPPEQTMAADEDAAADNAAPDAPADRLLHLRGSRWHTIALPDAWPAPETAWLLPGDERPMLVAASQHNQELELRVFQWNGQRWQDERYRLPDARSEAMDVLKVDGHLLVGIARDEAEQDLTVAVSLLRRGDVRPVGEATLELAGTRHWRLLPAEGGVALAGKADEPRVSAAGAYEPTLHWMVMDLHGNVLRPTEPIQTREREPEGEAANYVLMGTLVVLGLLLVLVFWRRDMHRPQLELPEGTELGDLPRRALAGVIDLAPLVAIVMGVYRINAVELLMAWPGQGTASTWDAMTPGMIVIVAFVIYTTLAELATGRTLGKTVVGMRVAGLDGARPNPSQIVARNLLKVMDLIAWLLLLLPLLGPLRQRLGDLVARTVVVMDTERPADEE